MSRTMTRRRRDYGFTWRGRLTAQCKRCKKFVKRPSAVCRWCGNDPVTYRGDRRQYDLAHGWED
jgi:rRNA maturation endonuclease Nob1